jgi:hypothetical protein
LEDDATLSDPGHETVEAAFKRIYKVEMCTPLETWDGGDALYKLMPEGEFFVVLVESYPGNSEIRELLEYSDAKVVP